MSGRRADRQDELELLCERCGYSIEGLPPAANCPECGRPVAASLPLVRPGSRWQISPSLTSWMHTNAGVLRRPRAAMRAIQIEGVRSRELGRVNIAASALLLAAVPSIYLFVLPLLGFDSTLIALFKDENEMPALIWPLGMWACFAADIWLLTAVETLGIRTLGRARTSRITPTVARSITSHATAAWLAASVLVALGLVMALILHETAMRHNVGVFRGALMLAPLWVPAICGILGLLCFETLVYIGVLQCRFANRSKANELLSPVLFDNGAQGLDVQGESGQSA